jgi:Uma2 family endonuclease
MTSMGARSTSKSAPRVKSTYADFLLFPDDGKRHELIDGEHYVSPSPNVRHQTLSGRLFQAIANFLDAEPIGDVWSAPLDVVLSNYDVVEPDLIYVSKQRQSILTEQNVKGAPDLAIEILSRGTRKKDTVIKHRAYEHFGMSEYWLVDPKLNVVKVHRLIAGKFECAAELSPQTGDVLTTPLLPGLSIDLGSLFR